MKSRQGCRAFGTGGGPGWRSRRGRPARKGRWWPVVARGATCGRQDGRPAPRRSYLGTHSSRAVLVEGLGGGRAYKGPAIGGIYRRCGRGGGARSGWTRSGAS